MSERWRLDFDECVMMYHGTIMDQRLLLQDRACGNETHEVMALVGMQEALCSELARVTAEVVGDWYDAAASQQHIEGVVREFRESLQLFCDERKRAREREDNDERARAERACWERPRDE